MASKRKAKAEPASSRKKARGRTSEIPVPELPKTTRSGSASIGTAQIASKRTRSQATSKDASRKKSVTTDHLDNKDTQSKRAGARQKASKGLTEELQETKGDSDNEGLESKAAGGTKDDKQYWLMKAEPEDRFENGYNVKFSIDDLEAATEPEPWDGVRNYVARNNMRAMKKGDLAFFYHSNCKVPGIVGVLRIVQEHTVDESAFDPKHPYYDQKSQRDKPRWDLVHVGFVKKFSDKISLKDIQNNAATTKELSEMDLLKYKRLSVTAVKPHEWKFIIKWAGEAITVGELTE